MDQLTQEGLVKLRNGPSDLRLGGKRLHALADLGDKPAADLRHPLFVLPCLDACQIAERLRLTHEVPAQPFGLREPCSEFGH